MTSFRIKSIKNIIGQGKIVLGITILLVSVSCVSRKTAWRIPAQTVTPDQLTEITHPTQPNTVIPTEPQIVQIPDKTLPPVIQTEQDGPANPIRTVPEDVSLIDPTRQSTWENQIYQRLDALCQSPLIQTSQVGLCIYDLTDRRYVYTKNHMQRMRPASCQKLITCLTALYFLGDRYQYQTSLYVDGPVQDGVLKGNIYVVGSMDPLIDKKGLQTLTTSLQRIGVRSIEGALYADLSMKDDTPYGWGWCWDDDYGPYSALMVDAEDKFGPTWIAMLQRAGINVKDTEMRPAVCPIKDTARPLCILSHSLSEVMLPVLKDSHNICAETVFYQTAAASGRRPAGRTDAQTQTSAFMTEAGIDPTQSVVADGSGLSLYNYTTAMTFVQLLAHAYRTPALYQALYPLLPVSSVDGTLKRRMKGTVAEGKVHAKTGSVSGISTLSGYLKAGNGHDYCFCIMNQGLANGKDGRDFQDNVCTILCGK